MRDKNRLCRRHVKWDLSVAWQTQKLCDNGWKLVHSVRVDQLEPNNDDVTELINTQAGNYMLFEPSQAGCISSCFTKLKKKMKNGNGGEDSNGMDVLPDENTSASQTGNLDKDGTDAENTG